MKRNLLYPLRKLHGRLHEWRLLRKEYKKELSYYRNLIKEKTKQNKKCVFLVMTPTHGNLGDHAIAEAEIAMLERNGIACIQLVIPEIARLQEKNMLKVMNGAPIFLNGGGNLGTLWFTVEKTFREIIINNPKSPIVIFPSTIYYEDSLWGKEELEKSINIYNSHKNLYIYAREEFSYKFMCEKYKNVKLIPDMVLSLNKCVPSTHERNGCVLCLRNDLEKTISETEYDVLINEINSVFGENISFLDMVVPRKIPLENRCAELDNQFERFRNAELIVTDRLHAMIFCAITGTPCVLINSKSPKIRGCYEWVKNLPYIKFADNVENVCKLYKEIPVKEHIYDNSHLQPMYEELEQDILETLR